MNSLIFFFFFVYTWLARKIKRQTEPTIRPQLKNIGQYIKALNSWIRLEEKNKMIFNYIKYFILIINLYKDANNII